MFPHDAVPDVPDAIPNDSIADVTVVTNITDTVADHTGTVTDATSPTPSPVPTSPTPRRRHHRTDDVANAIVHVTDADAYITNTFPDNSDLDVTDAIAHDIVTDAPNALSTNTASDLHTA